MELLYIWLNKYKGLNKMGLNFSNEFVFRFHEDTKTLEVRKVDNYIPNFFSNNITNFTGIVGENGTGKTSILKYILEYFSSGIHNNDHEIALVIVRLNGKLQRFGYLNKDLKLSGDISSLEIIEDAETLKSSATAIFLSNIFDPTSFLHLDYSKQQFGDTKNLSTWHLLNMDIQNRYGIDYQQPAISFNQKIGAFTAQELMRMVRLLRWMEGYKILEKSIPLKKLPYLNFTLYFDKEHNGNTNLDALNWELDLYFGSELSLKNQFLLKAFRAVVFHFVGEGKFVSGSDDIRGQYEILPDLVIEFLRINAIDSIDGDTSIYPYLKNVFEYVLERQEYTVIGQRIIEMSAFLGLLVQVVHEEGIIISPGVDTLSFKIGQESQGSLDRLIDANYAVDRISVFADFYFSHDPAGDPALSSGEYAIYMVFARLNDLKLDSHGKVKPLLMLIDEAEMALHPQWQKEFVFHFTEFIKIRFANYKVQVIFTSHSPFIVSDLPPNCILFLKKDLNHTVVEHGLKRANATFGANIHELFTDAFFLRDGLIGEFARRKIENLVSRVSEKSEYDQFEYVNLKKEIDIIGEPYVRYKLLEKIMNGLSDKEFDKVIEERESELEKLKNTRGDKNPG